MKRFVLLTIILATAVFNSFAQQNSVAVTGGLKPNMNTALKTTSKGNKAVPTHVAVEMNKLELNRFFSKATKLSLVNSAKLKDGTYSKVIKEGTTNIGNVPVKEAKIVYNQHGIVNVTVTFNKNNGSAFINAHVAKLGSPNNESVLDNFAWLMDDLVLEVTENETELTARYKRSTPDMAYLNEGVSFAIN